ncbi:MAG: site-2 protease family protein [Thermoleophilia bacterium]
MINSTLLLDFVVTLPILLASLVLHELAHGAVAAWLGDPTARYSGRLTLDPRRHLDFYGSVMLMITFAVSQGSFFFGWAKPVPVNPALMRHPQRDMMLVGAAGPLTNLLMAAASAGLMHLAIRYSVFLTEALWLAFRLNIVLALINLLPVPPLDGSRILGGLLPPRLYLRWRTLDRYGAYVFPVLLLLTWLRPGVLNGVVSGVIRVFASVLLPGWLS